MLGWRLCIVQVQQLVGGYCQTDCSAEGCPITSYSSALSAMSGYSAEQLQGSSCLALAGADTGTSSLKQLMAAQQPGKGGAATVLLYNAAGGAFWARVVVLPLKTDPHHPTLQAPVPGHTGARMT